MNLKDEQHQASHAAILESARDLIRTRGIGGTRVADVMKGVGLTVGGFYAHFSSKQQLVDEALRAAGADLVTRFFGRLEQAPEHERAREAIERYLSTAHRDTAACPFPAVVGEIGTTAPEHTPVLAERVEALAKRFEQVVPGERGTRRGRTLALVALLYGGLSMARALKGTALSDEVLSACRELATRAIEQESGT